MKNLEFREKWSEINPGCTKNDDDGAKCFECDPNQHHILYNTAHTRKCAENYTQIEGTSKCIPLQIDRSISYTLLTIYIMPTQWMHCKNSCGLGDGKCYIFAVVLKFACLNAIMKIVKIIH